MGLTAGREGAYLRRQVRFAMRIMFSLALVALGIFARYNRSSHVRDGFLAKWLSRRYERDELASQCVLRGPL